MEYLALSVEETLLFVSLKKVESSSAVQIILSATSSAGLSQPLKNALSVVLTWWKKATSWYVETKARNQAVKRNAEKFPVGYILKLTDEECSRSQIVTLNGGRGSNLKYLPYAFTERGLYMLATVLKSARATQATLAIIETYAQVRSMVRDMEAIQTEKAGSPEQANLLTRAGPKLAGLIGNNLSTVSRKTTIELNLALLKITHEVTQRKENDNEV